MPTRTFEPLVFLLFAFALASCGQDVPGADATDATQAFSAAKSSPGFSIDPPLDISAAAMSWRWLGIKPNPDDDCPTPTASPGVPPWEVSHLFDLGNGSAIPPGLRWFCVYERAKPQDLGALDQLFTAGFLTAVETDWMSVGMASNELSEAAWPTFREQFLGQAGYTGIGAGGPPRVRLAVVDTGATRASGAEYHHGTSPHGFTLVNMARELLCTSPTDCQARLTSQLALAYESFDPVSRELSRRNDQDGGYLGHLGDLAKAVRHEVHDWQTTGTEAHLILNLSMAWDPRFGGLESQVSDMPIAAQAVHAALSDAACRGVLTIAAAGNVGGGPESESGTLLPAAWEQREAPGLGDCTELLIDPPSATLFPPSGAGAYRPLVYAATGVRADGHPLTNSRPGSDPRIAAYGDHGLAADPTGADPTAALTGSSVSTLVTSAAAAAAWHFQPEWRADEVMETVYQAGDSLGRAAELCLGGDAQIPCPDPVLGVRRVSVCSALEAACAHGTGVCTAEAQALRCQDWQPEPPALPTEVQDALQGAVEVDLDEFGPPLSPEPGCAGEMLHLREETRPVDPCPHHQYHGLPVEPWIGPQPGSDPCPACWIDYASPGTLFMEIDKDFRGELTNATLVMGPLSYGLGLGMMVAGDQAMILNVPERTDPTTPIFVSFTLDNNRSVTSSVLVVEH